MLTSEVRKMEKSSLGSGQNYTDSLYYMEHGFTIIELLIVLVIISILASVLIPGILGARQRAIATGAQSYVRQCLTALTVHALNYPDDSLAGKTCDSDDGDGVGIAPLPVYVVSALVNTTSDAVQYTYIMNGGVSPLKTIPLNLNR